MPRFISVLRVESSLQRAHRALHDAMVTCQTDTQLEGEAHDLELLIAGVESLQTTLLRRPTGHWRS
jgi:hypothetical protein